MSGTPILLWLYRLQDQKEIAHVIKWMNDMSHARKLKIYTFETQQKLSSYYIDTYNNITTNIKTFKHYMHNNFEGPS